MTTDTFYTLGEAATILKVHVQTLRRWIRAGRLPARRVGRQYRLSAADLEELTQSESSVPSSRDEFEATALAGLADLWDNKEDAIYDEWQALYNVEEG
jgi:excisionase family DNA binding protein